MQVKFYGYDASRRDGALDAWVVQLLAAVSAARSGFELVPASEPATESKGLSRVIEIRRDGARVGTIRFTEPSQDVLQVLAAPESPPTIEWATRVFMVIGGIAALALLWVWVETVILQWSHFWADQSSARSSRTRAFMFLWAVIGWLLAPMSAFGLAFLAGDKIDGVINDARWKQRERWVREHAGAWLERFVNDTLKIAEADRALRVKLGLVYVGAPGTRHETLPNVVWAENGELKPVAGFDWTASEGYAVRFKRAGEPVDGHPNLRYGEDGLFMPAPGYTWASSDTKSLEVVPIPPAAAGGPAEG
jgi:hypothetical protein